MLRLLFVRIFVYVNTLYFSMVLLIIVLSLLYILVSNLIMHRLTILILAIVYVGAIIILIGYICAICPNLILVPRSFNFSFLIIFLFRLSALFYSNYFSVRFQHLEPMVNYFYSYSGLVVFLSLVFILFLTLLIVTSQYMTPKGPFRSVLI